MTSTHVPPGDDQINPQSAEVMTNEDIARKYAPQFTRGAKSHRSLAGRIVETSGMFASGFRPDFFLYALTVRDIERHPRAIQKDDDAQAIADITEKWESLLLDLLNECWPVSAQKMFDYPPHP